MRLLRRFDPAVLAGLIVVWAAAWSAPFGTIVADTKYDLVLDPWGFLARASTLWDAQQNWGGLANQAYGYLFPMGPFFAVVGEVVPAWAVQRLWWMGLLTVGFVGAHGLLRTIGVGSRRLWVVGALAWTLAPKVVTSFAVLSGEIHPHLLIPLILWPVVAGWQGRIGPGAASLLSGGAIILAGGVNGAAVLLAIMPTALFLLTRPRWWTLRLSWTWALVTVLATAWWLGPLLFMARFSAPFLDWIENSAAVSAQVGLLDVLRGTTQWLGHLLTTGGPWWPAGYELATSPWLIVLTTTLTALGLCGLSLRSVPLRGYLWTLLLIGVVAISVPHAGPMSSPFIDPAHSLLDGPLAAFRNIHKADGLVRLPLVVGLVHLTGVLSAAVPARGSALPRRLRAGAVGAVGLIVVLSAVPAFTGVAVARGGHAEVPGYWREVGRWLDEHNAQTATLVVPAANFGEYLWGRPLDEPIRSLTSTDVIVRDAIPLVNAGSIRLLDEIERRLQSGRGLGGAASALSEAGVRYVLVRSDVATDESGQPPAALARAAVRATEGVRFVRGFGGRIEDLSGERIHPVEVYELPGTARGSLTLWPVSAAVTASGSSDDLPRLAEAGLGGRPIVFVGDDDGAVATGSLVQTDGLRARETFFGAPRGADSSSTLTAEQAAGVRDYRPQGATDRLTAITYAGIADLRASSSIAERLTFAGLNPAMRPAAALDDAGASGWLTMWDPEPTLTVELIEPTSVDHVVITPWTEDLPGQASVAVATEVRVRTDAGSVVAALAPEPTRIELPPGDTGEVTITITATSTGEPSNQLTGLATVELPGITAQERVTPPAVADDRPVTTIVLSGGRTGFDGCLATDAGMRCLGLPGVLPESAAGITHLVDGAEAGEMVLTGTLTGAGEVPELTGSPEVVISATSSRSASPIAGPDSVIDSDHRTAWSPAFHDPTPELTLEFDEPVEIAAVTLRMRDGWAARNRALVRLRFGGEEVLHSLPAEGRLTLPTARGDRLDIEILPADRSTVVASMELVEVIVNDRRFTRPAQEWHAECGAGPQVTVNGEQVDTSATVTRRGWLGLEEVTWEACSPVPLTGDGDEIHVAAWRGLAPAATLLVGPGVPSPAQGPVDVDVRHTGTEIIAQLTPEGEDRLLVMTQNASDGWRATVDGTALTGQVVDGRRQGFVVPAETSGELRIMFAPERIYRLVLTVGLALAAALLMVAGWQLVRTMRSRPQTPSTPTTDGAGQQRVIVIPASAVLAGLLIAGPAGAVATGLGWGVARVLLPRFRLVLVAVPVVGSAVLQAVVSPTTVGPAWLEGTVRVLLLVALGAAAGGAAGDKAGDRQLEDLVAQEA